MWEGESGHGGWWEEGEVLLSASGPKNDAFLSQTLPHPLKLLGRAPDIGAGCLPGMCVSRWPVSPGCHNQLIDVTEAIVQIKRRYRFPSK